MNFLIDADSAIYKAGCANEKRMWFACLGDNVVYADTYKATVREWLKDTYEETASEFELVMQKEAGPLSHSIANIKSLMLKITAHPRCTDYQVFISGKDNFRYDLDPNYKGTRDKLSRPIHEKQIREYLIKQWDAQVVDNIEVDDEVSILCVEDPATSVIVSIDKDLDNTPGWHYNYDKDTTYYIDEHQASLNFYRQLLSGDPTDNIPGIKGIGKKRAEDTLQLPLTDERLCSIVWKVYQEHGYDWSYMVQQGRLLWMLRERDVMWYPPITEVSTDGEIEIRERSEETAEGL